MDNGSDITNSVSVTQPTQPTQPTYLPAVREDAIISLISSAIQNNVPIETLERLFDLQQKVKADYAKEQFDMAMAGFQAECPIIQKTKAVRTNTGVIAYKYAPIESIVSQVRHLLHKYNLSYSVDTITAEKTVTAICTIHHIAGYSRASSYTVHLFEGTKIMNEGQKDAASLTFAKRYAFCNALGIMTGEEDTDGTLPVVDGMTEKKADLIRSIETIITEHNLDREVILKKNLSVEKFEQQTEEVLEKFMVYLQRKYN